ncbi:MAG TPA: alpha/beta hydrolase [Ohtaekwangia sp.]|nr:alpha/beta hydrolase [Ohtaekwangia sp.]
MKKITTFAILLCVLPFLVAAQEIINLYSGIIPNSKVKATKETESPIFKGMYRQSAFPTLEVYLADKIKSTGAAVVICPGGGYSVLVYDGEGVSTAKELAKNGVTAFVLKYRLPNDSTMKDKTIGPLQDAQQAIKVVRERAKDWDIDPDKIGIMGFSAGGHLASTEATHFKNALIENKNKTSLRPDFQILVYPVISMRDSLTHRDSRRKLLGKDPSANAINDFSNELQVTEDTPPAYITYATDDKLVDVDNGIAYYQALRHRNVDVEMHIYSKGGHGFIFREKSWTDPLFQWMRKNELLK